MFVVFLLLVASLVQAKGPFPISFGNGLAGFHICEEPTILLRHELSSSASYGLMSHFWSTGNTDDVLVEYLIDGEENPSISFEPALACGQGFAQEAGDFVSKGGLYTAGGKMGKSANVGAFYTYARIPFYFNISIQTRARPGTGCRRAYMIVRGFEVASDSPMAAGFALPSGFVVPFGARMELQQISNTVFPPLWFVSLANVSFGRSGVLVQHSMAIESRPSQNNYIEGCWHVLTNGSAQIGSGMVVGTGFEDFYDSSFWFSAASGYADSLPFQHPNSGLTFFSRAGNAERISAYRFFDAEVVGFHDGGRLVWRVGDQTSKCGTVGTASPIGTPSAANITSYAWLYTWQNGLSPGPLSPLPQHHMSYTCRGDKCVAVPDESGAFWDSDCGGACTAPPPPPSPPGPPSVVGCSSGRCDAFCSSTAVHGCLASWTGSISLRAPATGRPCGGDLGKCAAPADACAAGWALCLSNTLRPGANVEAFRSGIDPTLCASGDPRAFVAAMQHADPTWSSLPPQPCPHAPQDADNGCRAEGWGTEPVCCGLPCVVPSCPNDIWVGATRIHVGEGEGCGAMGTDYASGVLCCRLP